MSRCKKYSKLRHVPRLIYPAEDSMHETWGWFSEFPRYSPHTHIHIQSYEPNCASRSSRVRQLEHALKGSNPLGDSKPNNENLRHFVCLKLKLEAPRFSRAHFFLKNLREDPVFTKESVRKKKKKNRKDFVCKETCELTSIRRWVVSHATI